MGITRINRRLAAQLAPDWVLQGLCQGKITEYLLLTGAKLVLMQQGCVRRYAVFGYASDGSDGDLANLLPAAA